MANTRKIQVKGYCVKAHTRKAPTKPRNVKKLHVKKKSSSFKKNTAWKFEHDKQKVAQKLLKTKKQVSYSLQKFGPNDYAMGRPGKTVKSGFASYNDALNYRDKVETPNEERIRTKTKNSARSRIYDIRQDEYKTIVLNGAYINRIMKLKDQEAFYKKYKKYL